MPLADMVARYLGGMTPGSQQLDPQAQESLARAALLQFGTGLLSGASAPPGDLGAVLGTSLARGAGAYAQGVGSELDRARQERLDQSDEAWRQAQLDLAQRQEERLGERQEKDIEMLNFELLSAEQEQEAIERFKQGLARNPEASSTYAELGIDIGSAPDAIVKAAMEHLGAEVIRQIAPESLDPWQQVQKQLSETGLGLEARRADISEREVALRERLAEGQGEPPVPPGGLYQAARGNFQGPAVSPEEVAAAAGLPPAFLESGQNREEVAKLIRRYGPEGAESLIREEYEKRIARRRPER